MELNVTINDRIEGREAIIYELPLYDEEFNEFAANYVVATNNGTIQEIECIFDLDSDGFISDPEKLNTLAEELEGIEDHYEDVLRYLEYEGNSPEDIPGMNYKDITYYQGVNNARELGEAVADESGMLDDVSGNMKEYFNYESFGEDLLMEHVLFNGNAYCNNY